MRDSSTDNNKQEPRQSQENSIEPHPRDGYIILQRQIKLVDNLEYLPAGVVTAMPAYFIKGVKSTIAPAVDDRGSAKRKGSGAFSAFSPFLHPARSSTVTGIRLAP